MTGHSDIDDATTAPTYAGLWRRMLAAALDGVILSAGGLMAGGLLGGALAAVLAMRGIEDEELLSVALVVVGLVVQLIGDWLYFALFESSSKRATPGKLALKITVTDIHGEGLDFATASGRFFGKLLSAATLGLGFVMVGLTRRQQGLHDILANSLVVRSADEPEASGSPLYPGIGESIGLLGTLLWLTVILAMPFGLLGAALDNSLHDHPLVLAIVNLAAFSLILRVGLLRQGVSFGEAFPSYRPPTGLLAPAALTVIGASILLSEVDNLLQLVLPAPKWITDLMLQLVGSEESLLGSLAAVVIVAPLTEELLFRGLILRAFLQRYSPTKSVLVSALLFGAFHMNPWQLLGASAVGVILGWWYVRTGSVALCVFGHAVFNAIPVGVLSLLDQEVSGFTTDPNEGIQLQPLWLDLIGCLCAITGVLWTRALLTQSHTRDRE